MFTLNLLKSADVVSELKECLNPSEFPDGGGVRPLRACGTRFIKYRLLNGFWTD